MWKELPGFEGIYKVSSNGEVMALERHVDYGNRICHRKEHILKKYEDSDGYYAVKLLDNKQHRVHQLVASAFLGTQNNKDVDHIDGNRKNNDVTNLRYISHQENIRHTYELGNGHMQNKKYEENYNAKSICIYNENERYEFKSIKECAEWIKKSFSLSTKVSSIYDSLKKKNINKKKYYGFYVEY